MDRHQSRGEPQNPRSANGAGKCARLPYGVRQQAKRFLRAAKHTEHFPLFLLAIVGALGPAEVFGIRWKDVDLQNGRVAMIANLTERDGAADSFSRKRRHHSDGSVSRFPQSPPNAFKARSRAD